MMVKEAVGFSIIKIIKKSCRDFIKIFPSAAKWCCLATLIALGLTLYLFLLLEVANPPYTSLTASLIIDIPRIYVAALTEDTTHWSSILCAVVIGGLVWLPVFIVATQKVIFGLDFKSSHPRLLGQWVLWRLVGNYLFLCVLTGLATIGMVFLASLLLYLIAPLVAPFANIWSGYYAVLGVGLVYLVLYLVVFSRLYCWTSLVIANDSSEDPLSESWTMTKPFTGRLVVCYLVYMLLSWLLEIAWMLIASVLGFFFLLFCGSFAVSDTVGLLIAIIFALVGLSLSLGSGSLLNGTFCANIYLTINSLKRASTASRQVTEADQPAASEGHQAAVKVTQPLEDKVDKH